MTVNVPLLVTSPTVTAPRFGLLSVATLIDDPDPHWIGGVEYDSAAAPAAVADPVDPCTTPEANEPIDGIPTVLDGAFRLWSGVTCKLPGRTEEEFAARAAAQLTAGESSALELAIWSQGEHPLVGAETDFPAGQVVQSPAAALGALEAWLWESYAGTGVIHVPRQAVPLLASLDLISVDSGRLRTVLGTAVSAGSYPGTGVGGAVPADGQLWLAATPAVSYRRSTIRTVSTFDPTTNVEQVFASRFYLPMWEGMSAAVLAGTTPGSGLDGAGFPGSLNFPGLNKFPQEG